MPSTTDQQSCGEACFCTSAIVIAPLPPEGAGEAVADPPTAELAGADGEVPPPGGATASPASTWFALVELPCLPSKAAVPSVPHMLSTTPGPPGCCGIQDVRSYTWPLTMLQQSWGVECFCTSASV